MTYQHLTLEQSVVEQLVESGLLKLAVASAPSFPAVYVVPQHTVLAVAASVVGSYFADLQFDFEMPVPSAPAA